MSARPETLTPAARLASQFQLRFAPSLADKPKSPLPPAPSPTTDGGDTGDQEPNQNKNKNTKKKETKKPFFDPFDNPPAAMLITPLGPAHNLVLNKFAVVPEHAILATRAFRRQTALLEPADLHAAYACVRAYRDYYHHHHHHHHHYSRPPRCSSSGSGADNTDTTDDGSLFVFFNSGPHSGASQPHRHLQLLPVARMREGLASSSSSSSSGDAAAWGVLMQGLASSRNGSQAPGEKKGAQSRDGEGLQASGRVPFRVFAERIVAGEGSTDLHATYLRLYERACEAVLGPGWREEDRRGGRGGTAAGKEEEDGEEEGDEEEARISYNLAMTHDVMAIAPRVAEGGTVTAPASGGEDGGGGRRVVGKLALNGTVLAGTALVKSQAEWDALRAEPEQLLEILGRIGVPSVQAPALL